MKVQIDSSARASILSALSSFDVDTDGYIRDAETGAYKRPYAFDEQRTRFAPVSEVYFDSADDPLEERLAVRRAEESAPHKYHTDRIHIEEVAGLIHPDYTDSDDIEMLRENWFQMVELAEADELASALTTNGIDGAVFTFRDLELSYETVAEFMGEKPRVQRPVSLPALAFVGTLGCLTALVVLRWLTSET